MPSPPTERQRLTGGEVEQRGAADFARGQAGAGAEAAQAAGDAGGGPVAVIARA